MKILTTVTTTRGDSSAASEIDIAAGTEKKTLNTALT